MTETCSHLDHIEPVAPSGDGCVECLLIGRPLAAPAPLHRVRAHRLLRQLPNKHATAHFHEVGHPIIQSYEPGEDWYYCYVDDLAFEHPGEGPSPSHP